MIERPNDQYNLAPPDSLAVRIGGRVRERMFDLFMRSFDAKPHETVLDIGVTSDQTYDVSNYFERLYPFKDRIVAVGLDDASFLETVYPGVRFVQASALAVPFPDHSFDLVHSSAVLEHVGSFENQSRMVAECLRVARRGICLTTPNRWFPVEFHTHLPLVHWLPPRMCRAIFRHLGYDFFADEKNLNLMSRTQLQTIVDRLLDGWKFRILPARVAGWTSNLMLFAHREP
jgi:ubiquinone/menaquinone biosynthesis C-methylase UbiE